MQTKICFQCHETKPADQFYRNKGHKDGLSARCIDCTKLDMHRRWRAKHPEPPPYVPPTEKLCKGCFKVKPLDEFHRHKSPRDGRQGRCKACQVAGIRANHQNNPRKHAAYNREWDRRNPDKKADTQLKSRLGLAHGTYATMLATQDGKCGICDTTKPGGNTWKRFPVDHDDITGQVRGLLCNSCNNGIGRFRHDPILLQKAISYLSKYS
jgi:hypothetical protein